MKNSDSTTHPVVLVTGGAGYIGSHACKELSKSGYLPVTFDNLSNGHRPAVKWGPFELGDIRSRDELDRALVKHKPVAVMHFAADAYVGESVVNPGKYYNNNVFGSLQLLEAMIDHQLDKLVFSSTCATYGYPEADLIDENHPQNPINPYGSSKLMVERMISDFRVAHGIEFVILRYFNAAGADPDGDIGEDHEPETHLIPLCFMSLSGGTSPLKIYGSDYDTPDGTCIRDFIHVTDLAKAHVLALNHLVEKQTSRIYNLGNGSGHSVLEVIKRVEETTRQKVQAIFANRRTGDPARLVANSAKVKRELGWYPSQCSLDEIISSAWNWYQSRTSR